MANPTNLCNTILVFDNVSKTFKILTSLDMKRKGVLGP